MENESNFNIRFGEMKVNFSSCGSKEDMDQLAFNKIFKDIKIQNKRVWYNVSSKVEKEPTDGKSPVAESSIISSYCKEPEFAIVFKATLKSTIQFDKKVKREELERFINNHSILLLTPLLNYSSELVSRLSRERTGIPVYIDYLDVVKQQIKEEKSN